MLTKLALKIELPDAIVQAYDDQNEHAKPVEELMAKRLTDCLEHNAIRGLYFNDKQREQLETIVGNICKSPDEVLSKLRQMTTVKVNDVDVQLDRTVLTRAEARAGAMRMPLEEWLEKEIALGLETAVGLRG